MSQFQFFEKSKFGGVINAHRKCTAFLPSKYAWTLIDHINSRLSLAAEISLFKVKVNVNFSVDTQPLWTFKVAK